MQIEQQSVDGMSIIVLKGELDRSNVAPLEKMFKSHLDKGHRYLLLDLSECTYIDSAGLGLILSAFRQVQDNGLLGLIRPTEAISRLFTIMGLPVQKGIAVFRSDEEAVKAARSLITSS